MPAKKTTEQFIEQFNKIITDHSLTIKLVEPVKYDGISTAITVQCSVCGTTSDILPNSFLFGKSKKLVGCRKCSYEQRKSNNRLNIEYIKDALTVAHSGKFKYPYLESEYINNKSQITVVCPIHGESKQTYSSHIRYAFGCRDCAIEASRTTRDEFISRVSKIHDNRYGYDKLPEFISMNHADSRCIIDIECPDHGYFTQRAPDHLLGHGCPDCVKNAYSKKSIKWLQSISNNIQHAENGGEYRIPGTRWKCDGYDPSTNTIYEFHGDAFHGNIRRYPEDATPHPFDKNITTRELYDKTVKREQKMREMGYNVITIWESDYDNAN